MYWEECPVQQVIQITSRILVNQKSLTPKQRELMEEFAKSDKSEEEEKPVAVAAVGGSRVDTNEEMKMSRCGGTDPDGHQPGDLYLVFKVREDPIFRREGPHIHVNANVNFTQAILGGTVRVPTLTGDVDVKVYLHNLHYMFCSEKWTPQVL
nr:chaperone protein DnaJ GFA2, mitochondrial-like isoform X1 [Tanacetum cinerariifolium]